MNDSQPLRLRVRSGFHRTFQVCNGATDFQDTVIGPLHITHTRAFFVRTCPQKGKDRLLSGRCYVDLLPTLTGDIYLNRNSARQPAHSRWLSQARVNRLIEKRNAGCSTANRRVL